jgi:hypothetical protein
VRSSAAAPIPGAHPGTYAVTVARICDSSLGAGQTAWQLLSRLPGLAFAMGAFFVLWRLTATAAKEGIYATAVADRIRFLGWWLTAGALITPVAESIATTRLWATLADDPPTLNPDISVAILLTGLGLITFARVMRIGVRMNEDLEGTV